MNTGNPSRSKANGRKLLPAIALPNKPRPLAKRAHSYHCAPGRGQAQSSSRSGPAGDKKTITELISERDAELEEDVAGFLQFCPVCERQIMTPGASILFCSEA
ncbi:hypothetical protein B0A54_03880 [Friedmanniomyces endolithicus]|uniref:Uncharacterized protein n=1 Tax=Friedmanniomyces endolithicus TaxID=329885 RepID=A0A4U0VD80_9PEZI|nr:hypothetical protein LTS09_002965 [Friedmanniomyces endolithicus]TKA46924.1 hypothetical protein B0A54_03880 [Friedmanniomyces endolithicus]